MTTAATDLSRAFRFFLANAGYIVGRRAAGAIDLARAERALETRDDWRVRFVNDDDFDPYHLSRVMGWGEDTEQAAIDREVARAAEQFGAVGCIVERRTPAGAWIDVQSLWGIVGDSDYHRVVAAETAFAADILHAPAVPSVSTDAEGGTVVTMSDGLKVHICRVPLDGAVTVAESTRTQLSVFILTEDMTTDHDDGEPLMQVVLNDAPLYDREPGQEDDGEVRTWEVRVPITVTADDRETAIKFALDDLRDPDMEWDTFEVRQASGRPAGREGDR